MLKPYFADEEDPTRGISNRAPTAVITSFDKEVEEVLADRVIRRRGVPNYKEYFIKWKGLPTSEASWEPEDTLWQFKEKIQEYQRDEGITKSSGGGCHAMEFDPPNTTSPMTKAPRRD